MKSTATDPAHSDLGRHLPTPVRSGAAPLPRHQALKNPAVCDEPSDLRQGKRVVGQIGCWYDQDSLWVAWYNEKTGVVGGLVSGMSPAAALKYAKAHLT